jgi:hypothetical protein
MIVLPCFVLSCSCIVLESYDWLVFSPVVLSFLMILQAKQCVAESGFIDFKETKGSAYDDDGTSVGLGLGLGLGLVFRVRVRVRVFSCLPACETDSKD